MSAPTEWTHAATIEALKAASVDGVAPPARAWTSAGPDHPSRKTVATLFDTFAEACAAAGLLTASEAAGKRRIARREAERDKARAKATDGTPRAQRGLNRWQQERLEKRRLEMEQDIASGALTVRKLAPAELAEYERRPVPA